MADQILDMAKELGYALQQDTRFVRTQMAQVTADEDETLQEMIGEFNLKRIALNTESTKEDKDDEKMAQLDGEVRELYEQIMSNPNMQAYHMAKTELDKLVNQIGTIVTMSAQGQDPDAISTESCGGNCSGCSGCH